MGKILVFASSKGGVGKTTIAANVAAALSKNGKKVLCIDSDLFSKDIDMLFGEDDVIFDLQDVFLKNCDLEKATVNHKDFLSLDMIFAPANVETKKEDLYSFIKEIALEKKDEYDFILIDTSSDISALDLILSPEMTLILVSTPDNLSLRAASKTAFKAFEKNIEARLILNRVRPDFIKKNRAYDVDEMIDKTCVRLLGIIYEDDIFPVTAFENSLIVGKKSSSATIINNIAERLSGKRVLLSNSILR